MRRRIAPLTVYLILQFASSFLFWIVFTVNSLYYLTTVGMSPLQLVLIGTILEATIFLFEIPTGVLADVKSRRLSVVIGYVLIGAGFLIEGTVPIFWSIALAQVVWGLGYTFTSGASEAWIVDEIGEARAGEAFLRGSQASSLGSLVAIPISGLLGSLALALPIVLGGALMLVLALFLALAMSEAGFTPAHSEDRQTFHAMLDTVRAARRVTARQPLLLSLLGIGLFFGLYSEGYDRLWIAHLLENFDVPWLARVEPVVWFSAIKMAEAALSLAGTEIARRRVDVNHTARVGRILAVIAGAIVLAMASFGLTRHFWVAVVLFLLIGVLRSVHEPLHRTWFNQRIDDPQVRATIFSTSSQVDAIGQIAGGPAVGAIGNASIRAALVVSAAVLSPAVALYEMAVRRDERALDTRRVPG